MTMLRCHLCALEWPLTDDARSCPKCTPTNVKETNPKDAVGTAKAPLSTVSMQVLSAVRGYLGRVPLQPLFEVGLAMMEGARKYGRHNYRVAGVRASVYFDAVWRHRAARLSGQELDPDSGLPHIVKEIAGLSVLCDSMMQQNWVDDRPPRALQNPAASDLFSWWEGQDTDQASGALVIVKEIGDLMIEREKACEPGDNWIPALNAKAKEIIARYPDPKPPFTQR